MEARTAHTRVTESLTEAVLFGRSLAGLDAKRRQKRLISFLLLQKMKQMPCGHNELVNAAWGTFRGDGKRPGADEGAEKVIFDAMNLPQRLKPRHQ